MSRLSSCLLVLFSLTLGVEVAIGQTTSGSIVGSVTDASGASVPTAEIRLTNIDTTEARRMETNATGLYQFVNIPPAKYRLDVEKMGFKRIAREPIVVEVQSTVKIDVVLEVGAATDTVQVTAEVPQLQSETSSLGQVIDQRKVNELPLNGRNPLALVALVPGVVPQGQTQQTPTGTNIWAWGNYQIGGGMADQSSSYLDGAPMNIAYGHIVSFVPSQDALQEFKVQTNNLSADFGRFAGGVVNFSTKSGTNTLHGSVFEFLRNKVLNANAFFNNASGVKTPAFTQNQFGGTIGGPVYIPRVYDGRNKTFFFFSEEDFQLRQGVAFVTTVPTAQQRLGDFSNIRNPDGSLATIYDPLTTAPNPNQPGSYVRQPFPGNVVPTNRYDNTATKLLPLMFPFPNTPGNPITGTNNWAGNSSAGGENNELVARVDHSISEKSHLFGRYTYWGNTNIAINPLGNGICADRCSEKYANNNVALDYVYTLNPTTILSIRGSYLRFAFNRNPLNLGFDVTKIGWPASLQSQIQFPSTPAPSITGYDPLLPNGTTFFALQGGTSVIIARSDMKRIAGDLTKIFGSHTLKFGGEFEAMTLNSTLNNSSPGFFTFNQNFTASDPLHPVGGSGLASFLLGFPASGSATENYKPSGALHYPAVFIQDDWKITRKLTFNLGIRWEEEAPWTERYNRLSYFDPNIISPLTQQAGLQNKGSIALVASSTRSSRSNVDPSYNQFSPRVGLAYQLAPQTVIRAGYGIFWLPNEVAQQSFPSFNPINSFSTPFTSSIDGGLTPSGHLSNPFPSGIGQPVGRNPSFQQVFFGQSFSDFLPTSPYGYAQQWNVNIQQQLSKGLLFDIAYVGSKGTHIPFASGLINQLPDQDLAMGSQLLRQVPNPFVGLATLGPLAAPTIPFEQLLRPYPQYNSLSAIAFNYGDSTYEALQLKVEKRFAVGASILVSYSYSKLISDTDSLNSFLESNGQGAVQDWNNLNGEKSLASFDVPQRLVVSYVLDLPFGKGRRFLSNISGLANQFVGNWGLQGITTYQNGFPLHLTVAQNTSNSYNTSLRPNVVGLSGTSESGSRESRLNEWFNAGAFAQPAPFTFGNESRNDPRLQGDGVSNWDISAFKNFAIGKNERVGMQFRAEFFNLTNRPQFSAPGQIFGTPQFGQVSGQANLPRLIQFALRLRF
jgi:hypothetical protein